MTKWFLRLIVTFEPQSVNNDRVIANHQQGWNANKGYHSEAMSLLQFFGIKPRVITRPHGDFSAEALDHETSGI